MRLFTHIQHISFDAWNTLIVPNLEFSRARSELIAATYEISFEQAKAAYTQTKRFLDTAAELDGYGTSCVNVYRLLNAQLKNKLNKEQLVELRSKVNELFEAMPPTLPQELVDVLIELKNNGFTMNILSNTNYVGGEQLMKVVFDKRLGKNFFDFTLFSDEHSVAKPHGDFFHMMHREVNKLHRRRNLDGKTFLNSSEILHIGDNQITDVAGGARSLMGTLLVADPLDTARKLKEAIDNA